MKCAAVYQNKNSHPHWKDQSMHQIMPVRNLNTTYVCVSDVTCHLWTQGNLSA